jgi:hypothetical protein
MTKKELLSGKTFEFSNEEFQESINGDDIRTAKVFVSGLSGMGDRFIIDFNCKWIHSSKTFQSMVNKLKKLCAEWDLKKIMSEEEVQFEQLIEENNKHILIGKKVSKIIATIINELSESTNISREDFEPLSFFESFSIKELEEKMNLAIDEGRYFYTLKLRDVIEFKKLASCQ